MNALDELKRELNDLKETKQRYTKNHDDWMADKTSKEIKRVEANLASQNED